MFQSHNINCLSLFKSFVPAPLRSEMDQTAMPFRRTAEHTFHRVRARKNGMMMIMMIIIMKLIKTAVIVVIVVCLFNYLLVFVLFTESDHVSDNTVLLGAGPYKKEQNELQTCR